MNITSLQRGDTFCDIEPEAYALLSRTQQRKLRVYTVERDHRHGRAVERCRTSPECVHLRLEHAPSWCVNDAHEVTRVQTTTAERAA